ncbi:MAG: crosslink repair DNA glycosylase YcaQ family protein [Pirellulaceae bacterium]
MSRISLNDARQFILHCQLLSKPPQLSGKNGTLEVIRQLGYVQIDTISVVERAHHHILWTRVPDYQPSHLTSLAETERAIFDYWAHAASYLPIEAFRYSLIRKTTIDEGCGFWRRTDPELAAHVLDRIKREGPLMAKDFEKESGAPEHAWMIPAINQVIRQLFMKGELMVSRRKGIQKTYDLTRRVLPKSTDRKLPSQRQYVEHIIRRELQAHGLVKISEFGYLLQLSRKDIAAVVDKLRRAGEVTEVAINGLPSTYFANSKMLEEFSPSRKKLFHILSPFDNLIIQRKRTAALFGFEYTVECYVPAAKRKFGYFGLPLLYGNQFVGVLDARANRKSKILEVRKLLWTAQKTADLQRAFTQRLKQFANFCGCNEISGMKKDEVF